MHYIKTEFFSRFYGKDIEITKMKKKKRYPFGRVGGMSEGEAKAIRVRGLTMHVAEIRERKVDFVRGNGIASVFEHFESGSARQVVSVTLHAAIIDELAQTPFCLFCFFFFPSHSHPLQQPNLCCCHLSVSLSLWVLLFRFGSVPNYVVFLMDCWLISIKLKWYV